MTVDSNGQVTAIPDILPVALTPGVTAQKEELVLSTLPEYELKLYNQSLVFRKYSFYAAGILAFLFLVMALAVLTRIFLCDGGISPDKIGVPLVLLVVSICTVPLLLVLAMLRYADRFPNQNGSKALTDSDSSDFGTSLSKLASEVAKAFGKTPQ